MDLSFLCAGRWSADVRNLHVVYELVESLPFAILLSDICGMSRADVKAASQYASGGKSNKQRISITSQKYGKQIVVQNKRRRTQEQKTIIKYNN